MFNSELFPNTQDAIAVLDALSRQVSKDDPSQIIEGRIAQLVRGGRVVVVGSFSDEGAYIGQDGKLHLLSGDATSNETQDITLPASAALAAIQLLRERDSSLAEIFEECVAQVITA